MRILLLISFGATVLVSMGCVAWSRTTIIDRAMTENHIYWQRYCRDAALGQEVPLLPSSSQVGVRVIALDWNVNREMSDLIEALGNITHDGLDPRPLMLSEKFTKVKQVRDLAAADQRELQMIWEDRIVTAMTMLKFDTAPELLSSGLRQGGLTLYYLLKGRSSSAEMGHYDYVDFMCVNKVGQLVARANKNDLITYEHGFVDQKGPLRGILF